MSTGVSPCFDEFFTGTRFQNGDNLTGENMKLFGVLLIIFFWFFDVTFEALRIFLITFFSLAIAHYLTIRIKRGGEDMDLKKEFGTDPKKDVEGVWHDMQGGSKCLIARMNNPEYTKYFQRISRPYRNQLRRGTLKDDIMETLLIRVMAKTILLGWDNMTEDGLKLDYSYAEAVRVMTDYPLFRDDVSDFAREINSYLAEEDEEDEKNFESSSDGM